MMLYITTSLKSEGMEDTVLKLISTLLLLLLSVKVAGSGMGRRTGQFKVLADVLKTWAKESLVVDRKESAA